MEMSLMATDLTAEVPVKWPATSTFKLFALWGIVKEIVIGSRSLKDGFPH